jgi:predicted RNase H-like HicB family nuclease
MRSGMSEPQSLNVCVREEDGSFWATVQEFPGVFATGETLDELRESLEEGIALVLAAPGEPTPSIILGQIHLERPFIASAPLVYA